MFVKIGIIGLGYVGLIKCVCLSSLGNTVYGFDKNSNRLALIKKGVAPFHEDQLQELLSQGIDNSSIIIAESLDILLAKSEVIMVCIGTPSSDDGSADLSKLIECCSQIGTELRDNRTMRHIVICSTIPPYTTRRTIIPTLETNSSLKHGIDFIVLYHPEFLREGTGITDFFYPPYTIVGQDDKIAGSDILLKLYTDLPGPKVVTSYELGEITKYCCNLFHAVKITFANEVGLLCKSLGLDSRQVLKLFCCDKKLNISKTYLKPGLAFGGSCLPKDIRSIISLAKSKDIELKMLDAILQSNDYQLNRIIHLIKSLNERKIGIIGLSFKAGTDDLRESPSLQLVNILFKLGYDLSIFDEKINPRQFDISKSSIVSLLCKDLEYVVNHSRVLIITQYPENLINYVSNSDCLIIDVLGSNHELAKLDKYIGLYW